MKILVIDDSSLERQLIIRNFKDKDFNCQFLEACDGKQGLEILGNYYKDIGLIFLDWQMPNIDGMGFMMAVIKVPEAATIPIVMVTASGSEEAQSSVRRINPKLAGYVVKPYRPQELIEVALPYLRRFN